MVLHGVVELSSFCGSQLWIVVGCVAFVERYCTVTGRISVPLCCDADCKDAVGAVITTYSVVVYSLISALLGSWTMIGFVGVGFGSSLRKDELDGKRRRTCVTGNRWRMMAGEEKVTSESDVIVIGSGIGGLGTAALFARRGLDVTVLESHVHAGGAAHAFTRSGYTFDSGPSLFSGMSMRPSGNPLAHLLDAVGEDCEWIRYDVWGVTIPEGSFPTRVGAEDILKLVCLKKNSEEEKEEVIAQWDRLYKRIVVLNKASRVVPTAAVRTDLLAAVTISRYEPTAS